MAYGGASDVGADVVPAAEGAAEVKHGQCARCVELAAENKTLKDLLETQYRTTDKARAESDKADDEALEHKIEAARLRRFGTAREYDLVWALKRRLDKAEAKLRALSG